MDDLQAELHALGIRKILIADDLLENIAAASGLVDRLPKIEFEFYSSGAAILQAIETGWQTIGLVVTDNNMESENIGLTIIDEAWKRCVPSVILSGGFHHRDNQKRLILTPFVKLGGACVLKGWKDQTDTWEEAIREWVGAANSSLSVWAAFARYRKIGKGNFLADPASEWARQLPRDTAARHLQDRGGGHGNVPIAD